MLFNLFISDFFPFVSNSHSSNYADDNTLYPFDYNLQEKEILLFDFELVSKWFAENNMALNGDKYLFMCLGKGKKSETFNNFIFNNNNEEKILRITNGNKLTFKSHIM